jgi:predicted Zn-dependent protease with MMP-like domain
MSSFKSIITKLGLKALQRAAISLSHFNSTIKEELNVWPQQFRIKIAVKNTTLGIAWKKTDSGLKSTNLNGVFDLEVYFKNIPIAYRVITTLSNVPEAFTQNRIQAYGNIPDSMILIRVLNVVQSYLFPPLLSKRVLKRVPKFGWKQHIGRIRVYTLGLILTK